MDLPSRTRLATVCPDKRREPRDHNNFLAFIPITGVNANASDRKSGAFLFNEFNHG